MTARNLLKIANDDGPHCCKRNTFLVIQGAIEFLQEKFVIIAKIKKKIYLVNLPILIKNTRLQNIHYTKGKKALFT